MASTSTVRKWWADHRCQVGEKITLFGRTVYLQQEAHDAGRALEASLYDYEGLEVLGSHRWCPTGISGRTCQQDGTNCSLHNYSIAFDFDPFKYGNPHLYRRMTEADWSKTKFTKAQVRRIEAIRTNNGKQVWRWLGELIGDTMHWEITCSPADLATGINWDTVPGGQPNGGTNGMRVDKNSPERHVAELQKMMAEGFGMDNGDWAPLAGKSAFDGKAFQQGEDGDWGGTTETNLKAVQKSLGLSQVPVCDDFLWSAMVQQTYERNSTGTTDAVARKNAAAAQARADSAHARLDKLHQI